VSYRAGWACFPAVLGIGGVLDVALGVFPFFGWSFPPFGVVCGFVPALVDGSPFPVVFDRGGQIRSHLPGGRALHLLCWGVVNIY